MFQCVIVEEIIMLSSILLSWETFYRNSVQLLHFHLSNCHFQKKHVQYRKSIKEQQIDLFPLNLDCMYQAVWQQKVFFLEDAPVSGKQFNLFPLNLDLCESKRFFFADAPVSGKQVLRVSAGATYGEAAAAAAPFAETLEIQFLQFVVPAIARKLICRR